MQALPAFTGPRPARMMAAMNEEELEPLREQARRLCAERGLAILPYGSAWWIVGQGVSRVVADLAGVGPEHLKPWSVVARKRRPHEGWVSPEAGEEV